jgi:hypothetical protein
MTLNIYVAIGLIYMAITFAYHHLKGGFKTMGILFGTMKVRDPASAWVGVIFAILISTVIPMLLWPVHIALLLFASLFATKESKEQADQLQADTREVVSKLWTTLPIIEGGKGVDEND